MAGLARGLGWAAMAVAGCGAAALGLGQAATAQPTGAGMAASPRSASALPPPSYSQADNPFTVQPAPTGRLPGYLAPGAAPDASLFLPPAPRPGSPAHAADLAAYRQTRALENSARWKLAASDAGLQPAQLMADFACALGVKLEPAAAPSLVRLISRMGRDAGAAAARVKEVYKRPRPFVANGGTICLPKDKELVESWSYPSGHATYGWSVALVLAELAPDRAPAVLARGRAYGESRVVCGVHYVSDVEQGRSTASGVVAVLHADPGFLIDLNLARSEVAAARARMIAVGGAGGPPIPDPDQCKAEAYALGQTPTVAAR